MIKPEHNLIAMCIIAGAIIGALGAYAVMDLLPKSPQQMISDFYSTETAVSVSPSDYVNHLKAGVQDGPLIDLRAKEAYEAGHLVTAVNIPVEGMDTAQAVAAFRAIPAGKMPITYCYSSYCMLSREVGKALADNGIYVKHFTAGWYEIDRDLATYTVNGSDAGLLNASGNYAGTMCLPNSSGQFGC